MYILSLRTDKPEAEIGLYKDELELSYYKWSADRELSKTLLIKINEQLKLNNLELQDINGLLAYKGPGSFTGLRIGISALNALAYGLQIPIVSETSEDWIEKGRKRLSEGDNEKVALPEYGSLPHITKPKK